MSSYLTSAGVQWLLNSAGVLVGYIDKNGIERTLSGTPLASEVPTQNGINPDGTYAQYPSETTVYSWNAKSYTQNNTTNSQWTYFGAMEFTPGEVGPDGYYELNCIWGANDSANIKNLFVYADWNTQVLQDSITTNQSSSFTIRIYNRNAMNSQVLPSANPISGTGGSANPVVTLSLDLTQPKHAIYFAGQTASQANGDSIWIECATLKAYNPPVYSTARLNPGKVQFYGCNGHPNDSQSIAQHISDMKVMGMKTLRLDYELTPSSLASLVSYQQALVADGTGIQMCCVIALPQLSSYTSEAQAYAACYSLGYTCAAGLGPLGVQIFESGNELDTSSGINPTSSQGGYPTDFNGPLVAILRGEMRGCMDGIRAAAKALGFTAYCASNAFTVCSLGLAEMLWNGTMPDGSSGYPPVRWDLTNWHNYEDYGPLTNIEIDFQAPYTNLFAALNKRFGVPIIITEWNGKASDTDTQRSAWAARWLYEAYTLRHKYNIAFVCCYELYGSPWNLMASAGVPVTNFGLTVQSFISSNPDSGI